MGLPRWQLAVKKVPANAGDEGEGSIPGSEILEEEMRNLSIPLFPLQKEIATHLWFYLGNPMDEEPGLAVHVGHELITYLSDCLWALENPTQRSLDVAASPYVGCVSWRTSAIGITGHHHRTRPCDSASCICSLTNELNSSMDFSKQITEFPSNKVYFGSWKAL